MDVFEPFMFTGSVAKDNVSCEYPVSILRDTDASHSIVLKSSVPNIEQCYTGKYVILKGLEGTVSVPLATVFLRSGLVSDYVTVGVRNSLPANGVSFLLGNNIAGQQVVPDLVVGEASFTENPTKALEKDYPFLFPSCAVTRSMKQSLSSDDDLEANKLDLGYLFDSSGSSNDHMKTQRRTRRK